jgi:hypothetical protein
LIFSGSALVSSAYFLVSLSSTLGRLKERTAVDPHPPLPPAARNTNVVAGLFFNDPKRKQRCHADWTHSTKEQSHDSLNNHQKAFGLDDPAIACVDGPWSILGGSG